MKRIPLVVISHVLENIIERECDKKFTTLDVFFMNVYKGKSRPIKLSLQFVKEIFSGLDGKCLLNKMYPRPPNVIQYYTIDTRQKLTLMALLQSPALFSSFDDRSLKLSHLE